MPMWPYATASDALQLLGSSVRERGRIGPVVAPWHAADGTQRQMIVVLQHLAMAGGHYVLSTFHDVTDRQRTEAALAASEERWRKTFRAMPAATAILTYRGGRFVDVNPAFERLCGFMAADLRGKTVTEIGLEVDARIPAIARAVARGEAAASGVETQVGHRDGSARTCLASIEVVDFSGERCVVVMFVDINDLRRETAALALSGRIDSPLSDL